MFSKKAEPELKKKEAYKVPSYKARKGAYIVGGSGSGKTSLLNVFFRSLPEEFPVVRLHWHEFCRDGFRYMNDSSNRKKLQKGRTTFENMAADIVGHCRVFLLDEINITSITEGVLVQELFRALWLSGVTILTTSNYKIDELYYQGFNRVAIEDFLPEFAERCPQIDMSAEVDYRTVGVRNSGNFLVGFNEDTRAENERKFVKLAGNISKDVQLAVPFEKRNVHVSAAGDEGVARFTFSDLCGKPLGRSDYSLIATKYHTVFVDDIPQLTADHGIEFKRFVSLVDMMYDKKVNLHTLSEVPTEELYFGKTDDLHLDEQFAWRRCKSMLTEMASTKYQSMAWLMRRHLVGFNATSLWAEEY
jgi:cell division protein ZapE